MLCAPCRRASAAGACRCSGKRRDRGGARNLFHACLLPGGSFAAGGYGDAPAADFAALLPVVERVDHDARQRMPQAWPGPLVRPGGQTCRRVPGPAAHRPSDAAASAGNFCGEGAFSAPLTACGAFFIDAKGCSRPKGGALSGPPGPVPGFFRGGAALLQPAAGTCSVRLAVHREKHGPRPAGPAEKGFSLK